MLSIGYGIIDGFIDIGYGTIIDCFLSSGGGPGGDGSIRDGDAMCAGTARDADPVGS